MIDKTTDEIAGIMSARIEGVHNGETLEWEKLEWVDNQKVGSSRIIKIFDPQGDTDLVYSLISDAPQYRVQILESIADSFYFIEITE